jgi:hypothetical protein
VLADLQSNGHFDRAIPQKLLVNSVKATLDSALVLRQDMLRLIEEAAQSTITDSRVDAELQRVQKQYVLLLEDFELKIRSSFRPGRIGDGEGSDAGRTSTAGSDSAAVGDESRGVVAPRKKAADPEKVYKEDLRIGLEGRAWELRNNTTFAKWFEEFGDGESVPAKSRPPDEWFLPFEGDEWRCVKRRHPETGVSMPCYEEKCGYCGKVKRKERKYLRRLASKGKKWKDLEVAARKKYIRFWAEQNTMDDDVLVVQGGKKQKDVTSEICRVIFQNVYEPAVEEAVVTIPLLDAEISYEDIMDKVTAAMAADTFVVEVGEKTAMRRRLLNAWQFIRVLQANQTYQNFYRHLLQSLIILLTFISVLTGVMSYEVKIIVDRGLLLPPQPLLP